MGVADVMVQPALGLGRSCSGFPGAGGSVDTSPVSSPSPQESPFAVAAAYVGRRIAKACVDRVVSVLLLPFLVGIGLAVRLSSPGPALFPQKRVGLHGRELTVFKFRPMTPGCGHAAQDVS